MTQCPLFQAVSQLAAVTQGLTARDLDQPWRWHAHKEGVRFALIGTYHELRALSIRLRTERANRGVPFTAVHHILAHHHTAYRDLQAVLLGVPDDLPDKAPAPGEWPLRRILAHMIYTECAFYALVHGGLHTARTGTERPSLSPEYIATLIPDYEKLDAIIEQPTVAPLLAFYDQLHQQIQTRFADMTDDELQTPSLWWEGEPLPLAWRLHRFDAHLRQHTIQIEKVPAALNVPLPEGKRHLRLVFNALADVENATLGATETGLLERENLAETIRSRAAEMTAVLQQADAMVTAVQQGILDHIQALLTQNPTLVDARDPNNLPITLTATYNQRPDIAQFLVEKGARLDLYTAVAIGKLDTVQELINSGYKAVDDFNSDGFNSLQLACFFDQEATALWLIEQGADVNAVSQNKNSIRPVHAAAAGGNLTILSALLAAGANPNRQQ
ncbi:MAG: DinB family protein, partial [Anaerolineales bacterium]|nr:DinB family protein [Anaerolineales bacterium]